RSSLTGESTLFHVSRDASDLEPAGTVADAHASAERPSVGEITARESLIDDGDRDPAIEVGGVEGAALEDGNAHSFEIISGGVVDGNAIVLACCLRVRQGCAFDLKTVGHHESSVGNAGDGGRGFDTWRGAGLFEQRVDEGLLPLGALILPT